MSRLSPYQASLITVNTMMGYGIITQPCVFNNAGLLIGSAMFVFIFLVTGLTQYFLCISAKNQRKDNVFFTDVAYKAGRYIGYLCDITIYLIINLVFIFFMNKIYEYIGLYLRYDSLVLIKSIVIPTIFILCLILSVDKLKISSYISIAGVLYITFLMGYGYFSISKPYENINLYGDNLKSGVTNIIFALVCQHCTLDIFNSIEDRTDKNIIIFSFLGSFIGTAFCAAVGYFGCCALNRPDCDVIVTLLTRSDTVYNHYMIDIAAISFILILICAAIAIFFPIINVTGAFYTRFTTKKPNFTVLKIVKGILLLGLTLILNNPGFLLGIISATLINIMSFILPSIIFLRLGNGSLLMNIIAAFILVFGITSFVLMNFF